ncbi:hypothetical protein I3843_06G071300 [Carya illinoinensis]|uniref:CDP-diacylglycerol-glycerol-3-phosphate 3-phosphatidyltransferase n=1 Tax=Carya illinoinensis TaxID=32201 RepID=A0A8T1Q941_CARIL|nr:hypothetical protein CIPAW_06G076300 [Carya illinoinensis]KAG6708349.1 hypothetical protein I3842_06G077100 [Carya illinoinensis]KAG7974898.1 hypothetical protein I3843_06G071300 [Carya illinoinensis]
MESNNSYTSWADQWDYSNPDPVPDTKNSSHGGGAKGKYSRKVEDGFGKTKAAASTGVKKVKEGASLGFHWIKDKYQNTTQKR